MLQLVKKVVEKYTKDAADPSQNTNLNANRGTKNEPRRELTADDFVTPETPTLTKGAPTPVPRHAGPRHHDARSPPAGPARAGFNDEVVSPFLTAHGRS